MNSDVIELTSCANSLTAKSEGVSVNGPSYSVSNNKSNSREDAKAQRNDYHVSVFLRVFASSREQLFLSVRALMAG